MFDPLISAMSDDSLFDAYNGMEAQFSLEPDDEIGSPFNQAQKYAVIIRAELTRRGIEFKDVGLRIERA